MDIRSLRIPRVRRLWAVPVVMLVLAVNIVGGRASASVAEPPSTDDQIAAFVASQVADSGIPGAALAIVRDGRVSTVRAFGVADSSGRPITPDTPFTIGSLTKSITATAVLQLAEAGKVDLDAPVRTYVPEFTLADAAAADRITVRQLLDQTSGLTTSLGQRPLSQPVTDLASQVRALADARPATEPGAACAYSNANYEILGRLVEEVSGQPYADYVRDHVFAPLGMRDATADPAVAATEGLTRAHRFWFGQAIEVAPLTRPDLAPAGFVMASATDMGRFIAAQLDGGTLDGQRVLSAADVTQMQHGVAPMGVVEAGRYGLGWVDNDLGGIRMVGHSGSTTDMASVALFAPDLHEGIVLLLNGQSVLYELAHKPDLIGAAAFSMLVGRQPGGTLVLLYPALIVLVALLLGYTLFRLVRTVRRARRSEDMVPTFLGRRSLGILVALYLDLVLPIQILYWVPVFLGAPWTVLLRIDIGQVAFAFATLRLLTGVVIAIAWWRGRRRAASAEPAPVPGAAEPA